VHNEHILIFFLNLPAGYLKSFHGSLAKSGAAVKSNNFSSVKILGSLFGKQRTNDDAASIYCYYSYTII